MPVRNGPRGPVATQYAPLAQPQAAPTTWSFGPQFQGALLKLLLSDGFFARPLTKHIKPQFFQNDALGWAWATALQYKTQYGTLPSFAYIIDRVAYLDPSYQPLYWQVLSQARETPITDEQWLRESTLDFIKRSLFRGAYQDAKDLFTAGKIDAAYDLMQGQMDELRTVSWEHVDRGWLAEDFIERMSQRQSPESADALIGTGIPALDNLLGGGAYPGFVGTWLAYPKHGKSTLLVNLAATAIRSYFKRVLHTVHEGSRGIVEARYDAIFLDEFYAKVKKGDVDAQKYAVAVKEMSYIKSLCVIRGFTDSWEANILHIDEELKELRRQYDWKPDVIMVDYADLLRARPEKGTNLTETQHQIWAYKDVKSLANRGYRVWTASQVQRPDKDDYDIEPSILKSKNIADAYGKVRICDFIGSINVTIAERAAKKMRLHAEMFRDGESDQTFNVGGDFAKMTMGTPSDGIAVIPSDSGGQKQKGLGYKGKRPAPTAHLKVTLTQMHSGI